ncbi:MAG: DUF2069 domain-containing protein [Gammaproteobacteria bacterium]
MTGAQLSRGLTLAGLAAIAALLLYPAPTAFTASASVPLIVLLAYGIRPPPKWGGWVAALIIPYFAGALGEAVASPDTRTVNWSMTVLTIVTFFAALDSVRRAGVSLRR